MTDFATGPDPRRWITLAITTVTVVIISLDSTVLNVAIPTILKDFGTTLPSLQWVITGYALTFASLLIIGGRLGDLYGHRKIFVIGAAFFGVGSLIAALSQNVPQLVIGEAVIEGIGASLMMPSSLAILSNTFVGRERATAFGVWAAVGGAGGALGPVIGGFLTSNYSWRWSFGINVIITPLAIIGALLFMPQSRSTSERTPLDLPGAFLIASGMGVLVLGLSEGSAYGWFVPIRDLSIGATMIWPSSRPFSFVLIAFALSAAILASFYRLERRKERRSASPLFEFSQMRHRGFRYGLIVVVVMGAGQLTISFVMPVFLQEGRHLSAQVNGLWQLPAGLFFLVGAQIGSRLARRVRLVVIARIGLGLGSIALLYVAFMIGSGLTFFTLLPGLMVYGIGFGLANSTLTNIVLSEIDRDKSGAASGAIATARQMGTSIGVAIVGSLLTATTIANAISRVGRSNELAGGVKGAASGAIRAGGVTFVPPPGSSAADVSTLHRLFVDALADGARVPLLFASAAAAVALCVSLLLPRGLHPNEALPMEDELEGSFGVLID